MRQKSASFATEVKYYPAAMVTVGFRHLSPDCVLLAYRLLTSAVFHVGLLHVGFNMMAFVPIGRALERHLGTILVMGARLQ